MVQDEEDEDEVELEDIDLPDPFSTEPIPTIKPDVSWRVLCVLCTLNTVQLHRFGLAQLCVLCTLYTVQLHTALFKLSCVCCVPCTVTHRFGLAQLCVLCTLVYSYTPLWSSSAVCAVYPVQLHTALV